MNRRDVIPDWTARMRTAITKRHQMFSYNFDCNRDGSTSSQIFLN
jgi:hypothetical protein